LIENGHGLQPPAPSYEDLAVLHAETKAMLAESEAALAAVGAGEVDALVTGLGGELEVLSLLEDSDQFFHTLVTAMQEGTASLDPGGTVLFANKRLAELLGLPLERVVGRSLFEFTADANALLVENLLAQAAFGPARATFNLVAGDRHYVPVAVSAARLAGEQGELCLLVTDLSVQKHAEADLRLERAALAQAQAIGGIGSWERDLDSGEERWSAEQFRLHGLDPTAGVPALEEYFALVYPDDRAALKASAASHVARPRKYIEEYRFEHPTLGLRTLLVRGDSLEADTEGGRAARLAGTCQDITEESAARSALEIAEERFRCSFDEALIGMQIIDLDGRYERVNNAFCAMVGYTHEQLAGLSSESITHPLDVADDAAKRRSLLAGEAGSHTFEKRYVHAAGHAVWAAISLTLVSNADNRPLHFIAQVQDITERRTFERQLQHLADHDPLTGLLNRRSFERELNSHLARARRYGAAGAVLMLDLDNFKYFNDTQGHTAGDMLIVRIAQGLQLGLRDSDVLARLGGDEFAVLLPEATVPGAQTVAKSLLQVVRDLVVPEVLAQRHRVTASVGIARFDDRDRLTAEEMMVNADLAMYDAKEDGRDRWASYRNQQHHRPRIESRMKWVEQINHAIHHDGFELLAQPIVSLSANEPTHYEMLLRMRDLHGDLIPPGSFLYVAERFGLIREIDYWVTHRAIDMLAEQHAAGRDLRLEVNLSGLTIGDEELLKLIERQLRETGVKPDRLIIEITETAAVSDIARASAFAESLSELGCHFALGGWC
jgi:diguanylate cyclase (GGDEF)-like protein/PAS domain S-box-containing protein